MAQSTEPYGLNTYHVHQDDHCHEQEEKEPMDNVHVNTAGKQYT